MYEGQGHGHKLSYFEMKGFFTSLNPFYEG